MGATKALMMETDELRAIARGILCQAGVLTACPWHGDIHAGKNSDLEPAYKIANAGVSREEITLPGDFTRRDLTDMIKEQGELWWNDTCGRCDKLAAD